MLFTAAAIPLLIFGLCSLRERCCCCQDDSESYAEDNRNLNLSAQILAWFLCAGLGVCLLFLLGWGLCLASGRVLRCTVVCIGQGSSSTKYNTTGKKKQLILFPLYLFLRLRGSRKTLLMLFIVQYLTDFNR